MKGILIEHPAIFTPYERIDDGAILARSGKLEYVGPMSGLAPSLAPVEEIDIRIDGLGLTAIPGLIDIHVHGGGGADTMHGRVEAIAELARTHARHGTTGLLPTTVTASRDALVASARAVKQAMEEGTGGAKVLGLHVEGPYINPKHKGAQLESQIRPISREEILEIQEASGNAIRMVTLAPELEGAPDFARWLVEQGIAASIGHTGATYDQALEGIEHGMHHATHLFNGMVGLHHREPGVVGAILNSPEVLCQVIADGFHLHPAIIKLVFNIKGKDGVVLITDAMEAVDLPDGTYGLGGQAVYVRAGKATLENGALAGSTLTMERAVANAVNFIGCDLGSALRMATINPARAIGIADRKGSLEAGKDADIVLLNPDGQVALTIVEGEIVYKM